MKIVVRCNRVQTDMLIFSLLFESFSMLTLGGRGNLLLIVVTVERQTVLTRTLSFAYRAYTSIYILIPRDFGIVPKLILSSAGEFKVARCWSGHYNNNIIPKVQF